MSEFHLSVSIETDDDGFIWRECPACERKFKWYEQDDDEPEIETPEQYFCPLCGEPAGTECWWTSEQLEHIERAALISVEKVVDRSLRRAGISFSAGDSISLAPGSLVESDDEPLLIIESPCHSQEPIKVPEYATDCLYCLVCGAKFRA